MEHGLGVDTTGALAKFKRKAYAVSGLDDNAERFNACVAQAKSMQSHEVVYAL